LLVIVKRSIEVLADRGTLGSGTGPGEGSSLMCGGRAAWRYGCSRWSR